MKPAEELPEAEAVPDELTVLERDDELYEERLEDEVAGGGEAHTKRSYIYSGVAMVILFFGTAGDTWPCGLALILMGLAVCVAPPRFKLRAVPATAFISLALAAGVGLLPVSWSGVMEEWRVRLVDEWSIKLAGTISADFFTTLEAWLFLLAGIVWYWSCLAQNFRTSERRIVLRVVALSAIGIALITLVDHWDWLIVPWWPHESGGASFDSFGPFAIRNHTSSFFALAAVLCASATHDAVRHRSRLWLVFGLGILLLLVCVILNTSRGGLGLFFVGITLWLAFGIGGVKRGLVRRILVGAALVVSILSVVVVSGGAVGERLSSKPVSQMFTTDLRFWLAQETLSAASLAPWIGRGLGLFEKVFSQISTEPFPDTVILHPESDILWLLFEGGLLCLIPCLILFFWWLSTTGPWFSSRKKKSRESRSGRRLRKAFAIASSLVVMHSIFDVPLHGLSYFVLFSLVASQAVRARYFGGPVTVLQTWVFRAAGLLMVGWGVQCMALAFGFTDYSLASGAPILYDRAIAESAKGRRAEAMTLIDRAIALVPMDYRYYYLRAQIRLSMNQGSEAALLDFGRSRALEPRLGPLCMEEGRYWLHYDPPMALIPWREGVRRYPAAFVNGIPEYQQIAIAAEAYPEVFRALWKLADRTPLQLIYFSRQSVGGELFQSCLEDFLAQHPGLEGLNKPQLHLFFHLWRSKGEPKQLIEYLKKNPRLQEFGWPTMAQDLAQSGQFEAAYKLAARFVPLPARSATLTAADIPRLERVFLFNPLDPLPGIELYYAQRLGGQLKEAKLTLEKVMRLPGAPAFLTREMASVMADLGDMRAAWDIMKQIMEKEPENMSVMDNDPQADDQFQRPSAPPPRDMSEGSWMPQF